MGTKACTAFGPVTNHHDECINAHSADVEFFLVMFHLESCINEVVAELRELDGEYC